MKNLFKYALSVAVASVFAAGCTEVFDESNLSSQKPENGVGLNATATFANTRTAIGAWDNEKYPVTWLASGESWYVAEVPANASGIHYTQADEQYKYTEYTLENGNHDAKFTVTGGENSTFYAYYPADAVLDFHYDYDLGKVAYINIPRNQTSKFIDSEANGQEFATLMFAKGTAENGNLDLAFSHLASYGHLKIKNLDKLTGESGSDVTVTSVRIIAKLNKNLSGQILHYFDKEDDGIEEDDMPTKFSDVVVDVTEHNISAHSEAFDVWFMTLPENEIQDFTVRVTTSDGKIYRRPIENAGLSFRLGTVEEISFDMSKGDEYQVGGSEKYIQVTATSQITAGDYIIVVKGKDGNYYTMPAQAATAKNVKPVSLASTEMTLEGNALTGDFTGYEWELTGSDNKFLFTSKSDSKVLYSTDDNNGVTIGSSTNTWSFYTSSYYDSLTSEDGCFYIVESNANRELTLYTSTSGAAPDNWRAYKAAIGQNTSSQTRAHMFFKKESNSYAGPTITASDAVVSPVAVTGKTIDFSLSGFSGNATVKITDFDGNVVKAEIEGSQVKYDLKSNFSTEAVVSEIGLTATSDAGETAILRVKLTQKGATPIYVEDVYINYGAGYGSFTVISPEFGWYIASDNIDVEEYEGLNAADASGTLVEFLCEENVAVDEPALLGTLKIWRDGENERDAVKVNVYEYPAGAGAQEYTDIINRALTGVSGSSYTAWSNKPGTESEAVYAGKSAGGSNDNPSLQLRVSGSDEGVVSTTSGGKVVKVTVKWNSATTQSRNLDIYCKNTPYSSAADLYSTSAATQGTKVGSFSSTSSTTELILDGTYSYIGFRSNSSALYLDEVQITWEK